MDWRRALADVAVVTVGVLLAFALNAWWEGQREADRETAYLRQLLTDVRDYERHLLASIAHDETMQANAARVLAFTHSDAPAPPMDSLALWVLNGFNFSDVRPIRGTLEALVQSGDVALIRNERLRQRVISAAGYMDYTLEKLQRTEHDLSAFMSTLALEVDLAWLAPHWPPGAALPMPTAGRFRVDAETLRANRTVSAAMIVGHTKGAIRVVYLRRLLDEVREIERLLREELGVPAET